MMVKVPVVCSRTGRTEEVDMDLSAAADFESMLPVKTAEKTKLIEYMHKVEQESCMPDLVVYYKGHAVVFDTVSPRSDKAINRLISEIAGSKNKENGGTSTET